MEGKTNRKRWIGVVSPAQIYEEENPRRDEYIFGNNYGNRIYDLGGIPFGILPSDGYVSDEVLDRFDGFLLCGGHKFWPYHLQVIDYAVRTGKPLLGICLGMQSIYFYFRVRDFMEENQRQGDMYEILQEIRAKDRGLERVEGHLMEHIRGHEDETKQEIKLVSGSLIHELTGQDVIRAGSFHSFRIGKPSQKLTVTGTAEDGTIEVIEYEKNILGVQFHPEIDKELLSIFNILFQ